MEGLIHIHVNAFIIYTKSNDADGVKVFSSGARRDGGFLRGRSFPLTPDPGCSTLPSGLSVGISSALIRARLAAELLEIGSAESGIGEVKKTLPSRAAGDGDALWSGDSEGSLKSSCAGDLGDKSCMRVLYCREPFMRQVHFGDRPSALRR